MYVVSVYSADVLGILFTLTSVVSRCSAVALGSGRQT
jgi:hypothetical protein